MAKKSILAVLFALFALLVACNSQTSNDGLDIEPEEPEPQNLCEKDSTLCGTFVDSRDGQEYGWVKLGNTIWMRSNLNYGEMIPDTLTQEKVVPVKWCRWDDPEDCQEKGAFYQWANAMNLASMHNDTAFYGSTDSVQGICPPGWRLPNRNDADSLVSFALSQSETIFAKHRYDGDDGYFYDSLGTVFKGKTYRHQALHLGIDLALNGYILFRESAPFEKGEEAFVNEFGSFWLSDKIRNIEDGNIASSFNLSSDNYREDYPIYECQVGVYENSRKENGKQVRCVYTDELISLK